MKSNRYLFIEDTLLLVSQFFLFICAGVKFVSGFQSVPLLKYRDPVFTFLSNRQFLFGVALIELVLVCLLMTSKIQKWWKGGILLIFVSICLCYRLWKIMNDIRVPCKCLGNLGDWLHLKSNYLDNFLIFLLVFFAFSGLFILLYEGIILRSKFLAKKI